MLVEANLFFYAAFRMNWKVWNLCFNLKHIPLFMSATSKSKWLGHATYQYTFNKKNHHIFTGQSAIKQKSNWINVYSVVEYNKLFLCAEKVYRVCRLSWNPSITLRTSSVKQWQTILPAQLGEGSQTLLLALRGRKGKEWSHDQCDGKCRWKRNTCQGLYLSSPRMTWTWQPCQSASSLLDSGGPPTWQLGFHSCTRLTLI